MNTKMKKIYKILLSVFIFCGCFQFASAEQMPMARVFYRPDGGVSIMYFLTEGCLQGETEMQCRDRVSIRGGMKDVPYDDIHPSELPKDRSARDRWTGEKGKGIWVDETKITRAEKRREFQAELDAELDKPEPNPSKVLKLERLIEQVNDIDHPVLTPEDLALFETKKQSIFSSIVEGIGDAISSVFTSVKDGLVAALSVVTNALTIGTPEEPNGITVYDQETGEPNCIVMKGGKLETISGVCVAGKTLPKDGGNTENINPNNISPVITITGNNPANLSIGASYADLGASITDNKDNNLGVQVSTWKDGVMISETEAVIDARENATYLIKYNAVDSDGNKAEEKIRTVIVGTGTVVSSPVIDTSTTTVESATTSPIIPPEVPNVSVIETTPPVVETPIAPPVIEEPIMEVSTTTEAVVLP